MSQKGNSIHNLPGAFCDTVWVNYFSHSSSSMVDSIGELGSSMDQNRCSNSSIDGHDIADNEVDYDCWANVPTKIYLKYVSNVDGSPVV